MDQTLVLSEEARILLFVDLYIVLHWKFRILKSCVGRFLTSFVFEFILSLSPSHPSPCASSTQSPFEDVISSSPILIKPIFKVLIQDSRSTFSQSSGESSKKLGYFTVRLTLRGGRVRPLGFYPFNPFSTSLKRLFWRTVHSVPAPMNANRMKDWQSLRVCVDSNWLCWKVANNSLSVFHNKSRSQVRNFWGISWVGIKVSLKFQNISFCE